MGVAADDGGDDCGFAIQIQPVQEVDEIEKMACQLDGLSGGEIGAGAVGVYVAPVGGDRGVGAEAVEYLVVAAIAGVGDVVDTLEGGDGLGAEQAVGVGEDAEVHGARYRWRCGSWGRGSRGEGVADEVEGEDAEHGPAMAGKMTRWGASKRWERPSLSMLPQLAAGGGTPRPRKLRVTSASTAAAMPMAAWTMRG